MQVLWFSHRDLRHPRSGGAERAAYEILRRLSALGLSVRWVVGGARGLPARETLDGIDVRRLPGPLTEHAFVPVMVREAPRPDVIVEDLGHVVPWFTGRFTDRPGTAFFHHLHQRTLPGQLPSPLAHVLRATESRYARLLRGRPVVVTSEQSARDVAALGIDPGRIVVIPLGVEASRFHGGPREEPPLVVYFGGLKPYKRPAHAIDVFAGLKQAGLAGRLVVMGSTALLPELRARATARGVEDAVDFPGRVPEAAVADHLARARLNVHCSVSEGWGLSVLEAAAAGVPTVAYDVPGMRSVVRNGETGRLVPDGNIPAMVEAAADLLRADPEVTATACRRFAGGLDWDRTAERWHSHLKACASAGAG